MDDDEWTGDRRAGSSDGMVHAVRRHLTRLLHETPTPFPCIYACFIHPRRRQGERGFGVVTLNGESLPLTVEMLDALRAVPTLFDGRTPVVVGPVDRADVLIPGDSGGDWAVPLPVTRISVRESVDHEDAPTTGVAKVLTPGLEGPQLTLLCAERPEGWPP